MSKEYLASIAQPSPPDVLQELKNALDALQPTEGEQKKELLRNSYASIVSAMQRKVPIKIILTTLAERGLKLHPQKFREMMKEEAIRRMEQGDVACCHQCGQVLKTASIIEGPTLEGSGS
ncbi:hypothetical protein G5S34_04365 [Herbaspirillum frisingense]|uniref:hypothetical protein n=1 Tax=Herbaspirillum frisingense TaxID=92645 RepID=UPI0016022B6D|nr:hypothetical protein [Herbaspirillum frisingense]QNB06081.1 hypothetical protein G5S34_04365 [Herbaspirillum frisingense]